MGKNIGYIRVSSIGQNEERQLVDVKLDKTFLDKASAGSTERPELKNMLDFIREGDTLHVHSMDRLARNTYDLLQIVNQLTDNGVAVNFHKEGLNFTGEADSMSKLMLTIMGAFAEFERSIIKERQREGIELAKKKGVYSGRKKTLTDDQLKELRERIENNENRSQIARDMGISRATLYNYLSKK